MFRCLNHLLLFCLVYLSENTDVSLTGIKGGNITLKCEFESNKIFKIELISESKDIDVCQTEQCSGRVYKKEICDVVIKDLGFSDAGKCILSVLYNNDQTSVALQKDRMYRLHITDEISVKIGKLLKLEVLLSNADKVERDSSEGWRKVWKRGHRVWSDQLTDADGTLTIKEFTARDAGTYRALDSEGEILITVTATESEDKLDSTDKSYLFILIAVLCSVALAIILILIMRRHRHQYRCECRRIQSSQRYWKPDDTTDGYRSNNFNTNTNLSTYTCR